MIKFILKNDKPNKNNEQQPTQGEQIMIVIALFSAASTLFISSLAGAGLIGLGLHATGFQFTR